MKWVWLFLLFLLASTFSRVLADFLMGAGCEVVGL